MSIQIPFNSLPSDKILDESKFKAFADDKIILTQKSKFVLESVENIAGKGENADYKHFLLFVSRSGKSGLCGEGLSVSKYNLNTMAYQRT